MRWRCRRRRRRRSRTGRRRAGLPYRSGPRARVLGSLGVVRRGVEPLDLLGRQLQPGGGDVLLEVRDGAGARDRAASPGCAAAARRARPGPGVASCALGDLGHRAARLGQLAGRQREPGDEADALLLAVARARPRTARFVEVVEVLHRRHREVLARPPRSPPPTPRRGRGGAPCPRPGAPSSTPNCSSRGTSGRCGAAGRGGSRRGRAGAGSSRSTGAGTRGGRAAATASGPVRVSPPLVATVTPVVGMERLADELLGDVRAVGVGGVDEVDAELGQARAGRRSPRRGPAAGPRCPRR